MLCFDHHQYDIYSKMVEKLYQCKSIDIIQKIVLEDVNKLIPSESSMLLFFNNDGYTVNSSITRNLDISLFNQYLNYYQDFDKYKNAVHKLENPPIVNRASDFLEYSSWERNEHRVDFLYPQQIYHMACLEIVKDSKINVSLSLHRSKKQNDFSDQEKNILYVLAPIVNAVYNSLKPTPIIEQLLEDELTARERQIIPMLLSSLTNSDLAEYLSISPNTLKTHIKNILRKTGCSSRMDLIIKTQQIRFPDGDQFISFYYVKQ